MQDAIKTIISSALLLCIAQLNPAQAAAYKVLYSFAGGIDGFSPVGPLLLDASGNLFGTTQYGGGSGCAPYGCGSVFKLAPDGTETVLHGFNKTGTGKHGADPISSVIEDAEGNLYGTTQDGGRDRCEYGCGRGFMISSDNRKITFVKFNGKNGMFPSSSLIQDQEGNRYGTTQQGGSHGNGTVYKWGTDGTLTDLYSFAGGSDGSDPVAPLVEDNSGNFYGVTTEGGGDHDCEGVTCGTVFEVTSGGAEHVLHAFTGGSDGNFPESGLTMDKSGNLYGTTEQGGAGCKCGTIFKIATSGKKSTLYTFKGKSDGGYPIGTLVLDSSGNLFGVTNAIGVGGYGTIYELNAEGILTVLHSFDNAGGAYPNGGLIMTNKGTFYGTTGYGGVNSCYGGNGCGTIYEFKP